MTQWFDDIISRIRRRYELTPEEFAERLNAIARQGPGHQDPGDRRRPAPGDTPRKALLRYRSFRKDSKVLCHALREKRQYMIRQWPDNASELEVFWMEKSLWNLDEHLDCWAQSEYETIKYLTKEDSRPEHIEVLMVLFFTPSLGFNEHEDMLEFLLELQTIAWEEHFLISLERLAFDQIWERSFDYLDPLCEHCHAFIDTERVKSLLVSWQHQIVAGIESGKLPPTGTSPEEKLLWAIFGRAVSPQAALEMVQEALAKLEILGNTRGKTEKDRGTSLTELLELVESRDLSGAKKLLADGGDVNQADTHDRDTALHVACSSSQLEMVWLLLANGADVNVKNVTGQTPLHCTAEHRLRAIATELLVAGAECDAKDGRGNTPLQVAAWHDSQGVAEVLLEHGANVTHKNDGGETPLHDAAGQGHQDIVDLLISKGASITATDSIGRTALHNTADDSGIRDSHYRAELAAALLDSGATVNAPDNSGITPLHLAAKANNIDIAEILLVRGANPNATDTIGRTPLHMAASRANDKIVRNMVKLLIDRGADPDLKDGDGKSPTDLAVDLGHMPLLNLLRMAPGPEPIYRP